VIQAHENARREDVNPVDEAFWFAELLERDCGQDIDRLCAMVGERRTYVDNRLELLALDDDTRDALRLGKITIGVAKELQKCTEPLYRRYYLEHAIKGGSTIGVVSNWVTEWKNIRDASGPAVPAPPPALETTIVESYNPLKCYICGKSDSRFIPESVSMHTHCRLAILDELLAHAAAPPRADS
jgi:hypothetical protein